MNTERMFHVYVLASLNRTLYTGVTNDLERRLAEHLRGEGEFTRRYRVSRLVHVEPFASPLDAIRREKQIKRWSRAKKVALIERWNPEWRDLAAWS